jgi:hypothetical protein
MNDQERDELEALERQEEKRYALHREEEQQYEEQMYTQELCDKLIRDLKIVTEERDKLKKVCVAIQPLLYGLLLKVWGPRETWPEGRWGTEAYQMLREVVGRLG